MFFIIKMLEINISQNSRNAEKSKIYPFTTSEKDYRDNSSVHQSTPTSKSKESSKEKKNNENNNKNINEKEQIKQQNDNLASNSYKEENNNSIIFHSEEEKKEVKQINFPIFKNQKSGAVLSEKAQKFSFEIKKNDLNYFIDFDSIKQKLTRIGKGGVYRAEWLGMLVAVKKLKYKVNNISNTKNNDDEFFKLINEINILASMRHPNIVLYMGASVDNNDCYMITEYAQEDSLSKFLHEKKKKLNNLQKIYIALQLASAIHYIHFRNIVHRDIKSDNIFLDETLKIKLSHFGLSTSLKKITEKKICSDNFAYMAPEIMLEKTYTKSADIFSYGMILWELITCQTPYANLKKEEIFNEVAKKKKIVKIPENGNTVLIELTKLCLQYKPENRPTIEKIVKYLYEVNKGLDESIDPVLDDLFNFIS